MNKGELVKFIADELKAKGHKANQALVRDMLDAVEHAVENVVENKGSLAIGGMKVETKVQKGRKGIIQLGDRKGQEYVTNDKIVPTVKFMPSKKKELSVEA